MIIVHHLEESRSQRVLWMLEELGAAYDIVNYKRDPQTRLAPPALKQVHPLGKSPVVEEGGRVLAESAAILEFLAETRGDGKLGVTPGAPARAAYLHWLHFAEGSAMVPFLLQIYTLRLGEAAAPLQPRISAEIDNHLAYVNAAYADRDFLVDNRLTAADIGMSFILDVGNRSTKLAPYPHLARVRAQFHVRPAYQRALERGGPYALGN